jgi:hypothetical protein
MALPADFDTLLRRESCAAALSEAGFPISKATLATKAVRGGGPPFRRFNRVPLYRWGDALDWARAQLGPVIRSTSEADAACPRPATPLPSAHEPTSRRRTAPIAAP